MNERRSITFPRLLKPLNIAIDEQVFSEEKTSRKLIDLAQRNESNFLSNRAFDHHPPEVTQTAQTEITLCGPVPKVPRTGISPCRAVWNCDLCMLNRFARLKRIGSHLPDHGAGFSTLIHKCFEDLWSVLTTEPRIPPSQISKPPKYNFQLSNILW